jgi:hypothetical protein
LHDRQAGFNQREGVIDAAMASLERGVLAEEVVVARAGERPFVDDGQVLPGAVSECSQASAISEYSSGFGRPKFLEYITTN